MKGIVLGLQMPPMVSRSIFLLQSGDSLEKPFSILHNKGSESFPQLSICFWVDQDSSNSWLSTSRGHSTSFHVEFHL